MWTRDCPDCGKEMSYSSKSNLNRAIKLNKKCKSCGKKGIKRQPFSEDWLRKLSEAKRGEKNSMYGKTRSEETRRKISIFRGGNGLLNKERYDAYQLKHWTKAVKDRDGCCQICGSRKKLHAHHIIPKAKWLSGAYLLNNGVTLCSICHIEEHQLNSVNCFLQID